MDEQTIRSEIQALLKRIEKQSQELNTFVCLRFCIDFWFVLLLAPLQNRKSGIKTWFMFGHF
jgi:hypothetical protein